jgi:hypothetical protein
MKFLVKSPRSSNLINFKHCRPRQRVKRGKVLPQIRLENFVLVPISTNSISGFLFTLHLKGFRGENLNETTRENVEKLEKLLVKAHKSERT